jgi:hypothetical protein
MTPRTSRSGRTRMPDGTTIVRSATSSVQPEYGNKSKRLAAVMRLHFSSRLFCRTFRQMDRVTCVGGEKHPHLQLFRPIAREGNAAQCRHQCLRKQVTLFDVVAAADVGSQNDSVPSRRAAAGRSRPSQTTMTGRYPTLSQFTARRLQILDFILRAVYDSDLLQASAFTGVVRVVKCRRWQMIAGESCRLTGGKSEHHTAACRVEYAGAAVVKSRRWTVSQKIYRRFFDYSGTGKGEKAR